MSELLRMLADHFGFLWGESRYRIVDSRTTESFGNALVVIASDRLRINVARDRGQFLWVFQAPQMGEPEWYDLDVIWRLLTGETVATATEPPENVAAFLRERLTEIEDRFSIEQSPNTTLALKELRRVRAKELFG
jgi:hypothetical protein